MKANTKKQLRQALDRGAKTAKAMVKRYKRKRAMKRAGRALMEIGKPAVAAAAAAIATVAAERLTRRGEPKPGPGIETRPGESAQA